MLDHGKSSNDAHEYHKGAQVKRQIEPVMEAGESGIREVDQVPALTTTGGSENVCTTTMVTSDSQQESKPIGVTAINTEPMLTVKQSGDGLTEVVCQARQLVTDLLRMLKEGSGVHELSSRDLGVATEVGAPRIEEDHVAQRDVPNVGSLKMSRHVNLSVGQIAEITEELEAFKSTKVANGGTVEIGLRSVAIIDVEEALVLGVRIVGLVLLRTVLGNVHCTEKLQEQRKRSELKIINQTQLNST